MSHQTFNKKSYGFLLYILYSFFYAFPYTSVDTLVQAKQSTKWQTYMKSGWICMPPATLWTFHRSRIYRTHPLHIWTSKLVSAIVANELCKTSKHKWFLSSVLQLMFCFRLQRKYTEMTNSVISKKKKYLQQIFLIIVRKTNIRIRFKNYRYNK